MGQEQDHRENNLLESELENYDGHRCLLHIGHPIRMMTGARIMNHELELNSSMKSNISSALNQLISILGFIIPLVQCTIVVTTNFLFVRKLTFKV